MQQEGLKGFLVFHPGFLGWIKELKLQNEFEKTFSWLNEKDYVDLIDTFTPMAKRGSNQEAFEYLYTRARLFPIWLAWLRKQGKLKQGKKKVNI